ncbi:unnamed protein product [Sphagnum troendelagicum]|uniref:Cytochrome c oxidase subunit 3 n=1 Tax=Sphagnum troendelagicum TaxID=128251 RepID=A0ABP0TJR6_9BRYO
MSVSQKHPYHLVDPSPWPLLGSLGALASTIGGVMYMHSFAEGGTLLSLGLGMILYTMFVWWRDVIRESTYEGHHTFVVQLGLRYGHFTQTHHFGFEAVAWYRHFVDVVWLFLFVSIYWWGGN